MHESLYQADYFQDRNGNDLKRLLSFSQEKTFIEQFASTDSSCLDIGCSTGEFLRSISWSGNMYGMEISDLAISKARDNGINIISEFPCDSSLDVIFFRGTIQHLDSPFIYIQQSVASLKPGGVIFFLATPNSDSLYYRLFGTLPALDPSRNFYIPGIQSLQSICQIYGLRFLSSDMPYFKSPYSSFLRDHLLFLTKLLLSVFIPSIAKTIKFPFWSSMMHLVFIKD